MPITNAFLRGEHDPFNPFQKITSALQTLGEISARNINNLQIEVTAIPLIRKVGFPSVDFATGAVVSNGLRISRKPIKGRFAGYMTIPEYLQGLEELKAIIKGPELFAIARRVYDTTVRAVIRSKLSTRTSLKRGGTGGRGNDNNGKDILFLSRPDFQLGTEWRKIIKELDVPLKELSFGRFGSFSLQQILKHNVAQYRSRFTNVFMMVEFGTGMFASPGPRRYLGAATPFKVTPTMSETFGANTSWWFSNLLAKRIAENTLKGATGEVGRARLYHKKIPVYSIRPYAFGYGAKGIRPLGVLFDNRGMVAQLRQAYANFYKQMVAQINELISSRVPFWPKNAFTVNEKQVINIVETYEALFRRLKNG